MPFPIAAALLDAVVLSTLEQNDLYGYRITQDIRQHLDVSESTLYPVLRRLQKNGCLTTYDKRSDGRNRRYYSITKTGIQQLALYREEWTDHRQRVEHLLLKGGTEQ